MPDQNTVPELQLAQILSDLVSLREGVCDPAAARALVSARSPTTPPTDPSSQSTEHEQDPDLRRAEELVALHYTVRERCKAGELGRGLAEARRVVEGVMGG